MRSATFREFQRNFTVLGLGTGLFKEQQTLAEQLYMFANDNQVTSSDFSVAIEELSLTAN